MSPFSHLTTRQKFLLGGYTTFTSLLGFKRGCNSYEYSLNKYNNETYRKDKRTFFYSYCILEGLAGSLFYTVPITSFFMMPKEIYRLEVNIRDLEEDKKSEYYNALL